MLSVSNLSVRYGEAEAVRDVSFRVRRGEWWTLIGPNGAGKSSVAGALGRTVPFTGEILLDGKNCREYTARAYARKVGILGQRHSAVYGFTVEEVVGLGRYARQEGFLKKGDPEGPGKIREALEKTGLSGMEKRSLLTLSGGEQQRVFLAQVLCQDPELLILDEPANHLDLPFQKELFSMIGEWLRRPDRAVITVMHDLSLARRYGTHAILMNRGRCEAAGETREVLTRENLSRVYGMDVYAWIRETAALWD